MPLCQTALLLLLLLLLMMMMMNVAVAAVHAVDIDIDIDAEVEVVNVNVGVNRSENKQNAFRRPCGGRGLARDASRPSCRSGGAERRALPGRLPSVLRCTHLSWPTPSPGEPRPRKGAAAR